MAELTRRNFLFGAGVAGAAMALAGVAAPERALAAEEEEEDWGLA